MKKTCKNERYEAFRREQEEFIRLREEIIELAYFIPLGSLIKYIHSFVLAAFKYYDNTSYQYYMEVKEGRSDRSIEDVVADSKAMYERIRKSISEERYIAL